MKQLTALFICFIMIMTFAGCGINKEDETLTEAVPTTKETVPETTAQSVVETESAVEYLPLPADAPGGAVSLSEEEAQQLHRLFCEDWWYHMLLSTRFATPAEADLQQLFSHGYERDGEEGLLTEDEKQFVYDHLSPGVLHERYDISKTSRQAVDQVLNDYLGKTLEEMDGIGMHRLFYYDGTDVYLGNSTERPTADGFAITAAYHTADGLLTMVYDVEESAGNTMVLEPDGSRYLVLSNVWPAYDSGNRFTDEEISAAIQTVKNEFMFSGCDLQDLWYDEDFQLWREKSFFSGGDTYVGRENSDIVATKGNVILILSNIYSLPENDTGVLEPDQVYREYEWTLSRADENSPWYLQDWGY